TPLSNASLSRQRPDEGQRRAGAGRLEPELDPLLQEDQADADERRGQEQQAPVQLLVRYLEAARAGAAAGGVDDRVRDLAVAFTIELEVLAAAGVGDQHQRLPFERRPDRRLARRRVVRPALGLGDEAADRDRKSTRL